MSPRLPTPDGDAGNWGTILNEYLRQSHHDDGTISKVDGNFAKVQLRRATAAQWTAVNPILAAGEIGFEADTQKRKVGDGIQAWNDLAYELTQAEANGLYATAAQGELANTAVQPSDIATISPGNRLVALGDSITRGYGSHLSLAMAITSASGGRIATLNNAGVNSDTTTMMFARFASDVVAYHPDVCLITGGSNDITSGAAVAAMDGLIALYNACEAAGIKPIAALIPPRPTHASKVAELNRLILDYASAHAIPIVDFYTLLVNPLTDAQDAIYLADGVHPNTAGTLAMGEAAWNVLKDVMNATQPLLVRSNSDPQNLLVNGLLIGDSNNDGIPDGWTKTGSGTTAYALMVATKPAVGNLLVATTTAAGNNVFRQTLPGESWTPGDLLEFAFRIDSNLEGTGVKVGINLSVIGVETHYLMNFNDTRISDGVIVYQYRVPGSPSGIVLQIAGSGTGAGTYSVSQISVRNLTTLGLDT